VLSLEQGRLYPDPEQQTLGWTSIMLMDDYDLPLSTTSVAARDAYVGGCAAKLTMYPGAVEAFDRAIAADPRFALGHVARAHALWELGDVPAARESLITARSLALGLSVREASHIAFFSLLITGDSEAALAALTGHINAWPRDAMVLSTTAFTNGLIGSSGGPGQKRILLALLDKLAPRYGDNWWFTAHHGMALSENGQHAAARPKIDRSLMQNPRNPWAAHASAHLQYEEGEPNAGHAFLTSWLINYPRDGALYGHLTWHLALADLEAGDVAKASQLFQEAFTPEVHSGSPRNKLCDAVSFLWRWELAGYPRDTAAWGKMYDYANRMFPNAGSAFCDMHVALAQVVTGNNAAMEARVQQIQALTADGHYPSAPYVPAVSEAFAAFERRDFPAVINVLEPIADELERIGGSHAQLDLVRLTLLKAYLGLGRPPSSVRMLCLRRPYDSVMPMLD
jgi:Flp pilus assembly protein TadD